jgi:Rha family phage regulatory protein
MNELTIIKHENRNYIDSREVAEIIGKRHHDLLRDIHRYIGYVQETTESKIACSDFFLESTYIDSTGRKLPCYLISKMGASVIANKLTGEKGVLFTFAYVKKFTEMENNERAALAALYRPNLGEFNAAAKIVTRSLENIGAMPQQIIKFLKGVYEPLGIAVPTDGMTAGKYVRTTSQIARILGIFSLNGNPHYLAVSHIISLLDIDPSHMIFMPVQYGSHVGISVRYDDYVIESVNEWLIRHDYPEEITKGNRTFSIWYDEEY